MSSKSQNVGRRRQVRSTKHRFCCSWRSRGSWASRGAVCVCPPKRAWGLHTAGRICMGIHDPTVVGILGFKYRAAPNVQTTSSAQRRAWGWGPWARGPLLKSFMCIPDTGTSIHSSGQETITKITGLFFILAWK